MADSTNTPKVVLLKGTPVYSEAPLASGQTINPGHLIQRTSTGAVKPHATAAGQHGGLFAVENAIIGLGIGDNYTTAADRVYIAACPRGSVVYALLEASHAISIGDILESNGDGTLQPISGSYPVGVALEAISSVGSVQRIRIEVM